MPIIPTGNAQANFRFGGNAAPRGSEVTLGLDLDLVATPAEVAELAGDAWVNNILPLQSVSLSLEEVYVKFGPNDTGAAGIFTFGDIGSLAANSVTPQVSMLVRKNTLSGGREGRGRMYVPGLLESDIDPSGVIDGTEVTAFQAAFDAFYGDLVTADIPPLLLHNSVTAPFIITSFTVDATVATQRRRIRG